MLITPKYAVGKVAEIIKANTSKSLKWEFSFLQKVCWDGKEIGVKSYFVSTVGINKKIIQAYVQMQEEEDTGQAELEFWGYQVCKGVGVYR